MAIRQKKYIDITSGVGGKSAVSDRELIARVFTTSDLCGFGNHVYEFDDLNSVGKWFGTNSKEYKAAEKYFGFISKSITAAKKISFFKWANNGQNAYVLGRTAYSTNMSLYAASNAHLVLTIDGIDHEFPVALGSGSSGSTYVPADIDEVLTAVKAALENDTLDFHFDSVTIEQTQNSTLRIDFGAVSGSIDGFAKGPDDGDDLATLLGIVASTAIGSDYATAEAPENACIRSDEYNDNYGSFFFLDELSAANAQAVAAWNTAKNLKYLFLCSAQGYSVSTGGLQDNGIIALADQLNGAFVDTATSAYKTDNDFIDTLPAALFATTDYTRDNATKSFMYQQNNAITPSISSDEAANVLDAKFVNYMGVTQQAGGLIAFYQDGVTTDGTEISVVCNEIWLKSRFWTAIMNLFLALEKVPANDYGVGLIKTVMTDVLTVAIRNGTVTPRKPLTTTQKLYIGQVTGNTEAWQDVFNNGYTLDVKVEEDTVTHKYVAKYVLVYSKGDAIRKVEGSDILI